MMPSLKYNVARSFSTTCILLLFLLVCTQRGSTAANTIREVDFKDFAYPWDDPEADSDNHTTWFWTQLPTETKVRLKNGQHRFTVPKESAVAPTLRYWSVEYGRLGGAGAEVAAVAVNYSPGGTMNWDYLYVYELTGNRLKLLGRLRSGSRAWGGLLRASFDQGALVLDFADADKRSGDCCSDGYIRVRYRWHDGHFREEGPRGKGDLNGG
jgi:hypothetical protein